MTKQVVVYVGPRIGTKLLKILLEIPTDYSYHIISKLDITKEIDFESYKNNQFSFKQVEESFQNIELLSGDYFLNLWGEEVLQKIFLEKFTMCFNIHPSLLPWGKGRDPIVWTILNLWPAGATFHVINQEIDSGPIIYQQEMKWNFPTKGGELYEQILILCESVLKIGWQKIVNNEFQITPQIENTHPTFKRKDTEVARVLNYDTLNEISADYFLRKLLAFDFNSDYTSIIEVGKSRFSIQLDIKKLEN